MLSKLPLWIFLVGLVVAVALRLYLPSSRGYTVYLPQQTRYYAGNVFIFWHVVVLTLIVAVIVFGVQFYLQRRA